MPTIRRSRPPQARPTAVPRAIPGDPDPAAAQADTVPGRAGPLVVNMPAARTDTTAVPAARPPDLRLPHERDQSGVDATATEPDPVVVQAAKDLAAGLVDTDLRNPGGLDDARRQALLRRAK